MGKKLLWIPVALLGIGCAEVAYLSVKAPNIARPSDIKVAGTPEQVARGKYLAEAISGCADCHSDTDGTRFASPIKPGGHFKGKKFPKEAGLPGEFSAPNLTSDAETGIGRISDGALIRAIREGIGHDGRVLFPIMPYPEYKSMSDGDVQAIVAYLRTLRAVSNPLPPSKIMFPVNLFIKWVPQPAGKVAEPDRNNPVEYGRYLAAIAGCKFCHTPTSGNELDTARLFGGGHEFASGEYKAVSANLTPDPETGIGRWSEEEFLKKFYDYKDYAANGPPQLKPESFTVMPWLGLSAAEPADLKAIFAFLKTVPAVKNAVETHPIKKEKS